MSQARPRALAVLLLSCGLAGGIDASAASPRTDYLLYCGGCHLENGSGDPPEIPDLRAEAYLEIAECLQQNKKFPDAMQHYRQAIQLARDDETDFECKKRIFYRAGVLAEAMQLSEAAREYFGELVKFAPNYKDAASRLDKLA